MRDFLDSHGLILMEGSVVERLRRASGVELHPLLVNAPLIYDAHGATALGEIYRGYMDIALGAGVPFMMCTPTWRANQARVQESGAAPMLNGDAVRFMQGLRESHGSNAGMVKIGGMIGCRNDCYRPGEGLSVGEAERFHAWQIDQLAEAGVDFLIAQTLPALDEAKGIARAMAATGVPYIISFVIGRDGHLLDGTTLLTAAQAIDAETERPPLGIMVNCAYPTFLCAAQQPAALFDRLIGYLANASSLDHAALDGADKLHVDDITDWGNTMLDLNRRYGVRVLGGCCGTGEAHMRRLVCP